MLISHEIPKQLFPVHDLISDYPYVLGHLLNQDKEYAAFYRKKLKRSKFSIFDNSAFELGSSIPHDELYNLITDYKPTHFILPDVLHDKDATLSGSIDFYNKYETSLIQQNIRPIGVLQGNSFKELIDCFDVYVKTRIHYVAIPYHLITDADHHVTRYLFFKELVKRQFLKGPYVQIHFLGMQNPSELLLYSEEELTCINSIDTSSPIINGWKGNIYTEFGLSTQKPKEKLADNLDVLLSFSEVENIVANVNQFKKFIKR